MTHPDLLAQIEHQIDRLSPDERLWLIERLARGLRQPAADDLAAMAADADVQHELRRINEEFAATEEDGLEQFP
jgi:hypothetical protein